jgi:hypothetical protein
MNGHQKFDLFNPIPSAKRNVTRKSPLVYISASPEKGNRKSASEQLVRDLFNYGAPLYPAFPGSKGGGGGTSHEAAEAIAPVASNWRGKVAKLLAESYPRDFTPDEAAQTLEASSFLIRPRFTELSAAGLIERTGERRRNPNSTLNAAVWRASPILLGNNPTPSIIPGSESNGGTN